MGSGGKTPPPPDYVGLANQQAGIDAAAVERQTTANRPTQQSPTGSISWHVDPATGQWTQTEQWNPRTQQLYDASMAQQWQQLSGVQGLLNQQGQGLNAPGTPGYQQHSLNVGQYNPYALGMGQFNSDVLKTLPKYDQASGDAFANKYAESLLARIRPSQATDRSQMETRLRLQGLQPGTEAYNRAYQNLLTSQGDVTSQAQLQGQLAGSQEARDVYGTQLQGALARAAEERNLYGTQLSSAMTRSQEDRDRYNTQLQSALQQSQNYMSQYQTGAQGQNQQFNQAMARYMLPYQTANQTAGLIGDASLGYRPQFPGFSSAGGAEGANLMDATQQSYQAAVQRANDQAARRAQTGSAWGAVIGGVAAGAFTGGAAAPAGAAVGGAVGSYFSDAALKEEIEVVSDEDAYKAMLLIHPHSFTWPNGKRATGLIADEVAKVFPHLVNPAEQGYLKVDGEAFVALLLGAFRHLAKERENGLL